jgi:molecular chaperone GrpE
MSDIDQTLHGQDPAAPAHSGGGAASPGAGDGPGEEPLAAAAAESRDNGDGVAAIEGDLDELVYVAAERDKYLALAQRTQADFENYRKRVARDAASAHERGVAGLARELLPALDNLDRALESAAKDDPLLEGVRLVRAELSSALTRAGIQSFCPVGEVFDPSLHEAVATAPGEDGVSGLVIEVYQDGYRLGESILRPARVVVSA